MKSAHRHELQTNALAQRLDVALQRLRPYMSTIGGVLVAIAVLMVLWSYISRSSASRQGDAWVAFNDAVGSAPPNLEKLHQSAQEYPGTKMQEMADITWADGQVFMASENYIYNRKAANESLDRAATAYQSLLQTTDDERLINRAHLGLARVYEMRNELERARDEYKKVVGGFADFAKAQVERLEKADAKETYAWLAKAEPPRIAPPMGPGTPGRSPLFSPGDLSLPNAPSDGGVPRAPGAPGAATDPAASFDDLLKSLGTLPTETGDRYESQPASDAPPVTGPPIPPSDGAAPDTTTPPATGTSTEATPPPGDTSGAAPTTDTDSTEQKSAE